jgi:hypothetical protein
MAGTIDQQNMGRMESTIPENKDNVSSSSDACAAYDGSVHRDHRLASRIQYSHIAVST